MPKPFKSLTLDQFAALLNLFPFQRQITNVDMHHTWRPNHAQFFARQPVESIEAMWRVHTQENGWVDIAQHITIDPQGAIWTGRDWNQPPTSAVGHNGNSYAGPFMFEVIGDFDLGGDQLIDPQRDVAVAVVALLQKRFGLPPESLRFHSQLSSRSCPGAQIPYAAFLDQVKKRLTGAPEVARDIMFGEEFAETREIVQLIVDAYPPPTRAVLADEGELAEDRMTPRQSALLRGDTAAAERSPLSQARGPRVFTPDEIAMLRPYVIALRMGAFSNDGQFTTSKEDVDELFGERLPAELASRKAKGEKLELMFYAHGGLIDEASGLAAALDHLDFWRKNGIYPIYFVWETGLQETVQDIVRGLFSGSRGIVTGAENAVIAALARPGGLAVWSQMKRSAQIASLPTGGALYVAQKTLELWNAHSSDIRIHAAGHSAGSIFHSYFLPALVGQKTAASVPPLNVQTLHLLAPAVTTDLFISNLMPQIGDTKPIERLTMYTMYKELEKADKAGPYQGSLLYLVSNAFEQSQPTKILGLEESIRQEAQLIRFFGLAGLQAPKAELVFSQTPVGTNPRSASQATSHGGANGFATDPFTLGSVVRRALNIPNGVPIFEFVQPQTGGRDIFEETPPTAAPAPPPFSLPKANPAAAAPLGAFPIGSAGAYRALCIGIDLYPDPNRLGGCVNDARNWTSALAALGFEVRTLTDAQATRDGILQAIRDILRQSQPGDVMVMQYSGHGTRVPDQDNVEKGGFDDAICPINFADGALIVDDDFREIFASTADGVNVTIFMDCCHSGTNTRLISGLSPANLAEVGHLRARFIAPSSALTAAYLAFRRKNVSRAALAPRGPTQMKQVAFAACQDSEVAFENNGAGVFTTFATRMLAGPLRPLTNRQFQQRVVAAFGTPAQQTPNLDCAPASEARMFLQPLTTGNGPVAEPGQDVASRIALIERRLSAAGL